MTSRFVKGRSAANCRSRDKVPCATAAAISSGWDKPVLASIWIGRGVRSGLTNPNRDRAYDTCIQRQEPGWIRLNLSRRCTWTFRLAGLQIRSVKAGCSSRRMLPHLHCCGSKRFLISHTQQQRWSPEIHCLHPGRCSAQPVCARRRGSTSSPIPENIKHLWRVRRTQRKNNLEIKKPHNPLAPSQAISTPVRQFPSGIKAW